MEKYVDRRILQQRLLEENIKRRTLSFYRYIKIENPESYRLQLLKKFDSIGMYGRIYLAKEGVNAQISVPEENFLALENILEEDVYLKSVPLKLAVEDDGKSFYKLKIKIRNKIVADGLEDESFDASDVGKHLNAEEFNEAMKDKRTIVVDVRNHYESEVGHFENAILPDADSFKEELPLLLDLLEDKKDQKILLYCTGGIRCEKASAFLKHKGFLDVNQLLGGIISYAHEVKEKNLENKFKGKNFVFDSRLGERISEEIISSCHVCGNKADTHVNCANDACHLLFIQCDSCAEKLEQCCSEECMRIKNLPMEEQKKLRKEKGQDKKKPEHKSRLRPKLN
jgi:UPF0176 protein